jgi:Zn-dependent peptidase ImmA (M78 family)/transcriptional regulator with XRE-family HTH domain
MVKAQISPSIITWAQERSGTTPESLAKSLHTSQNRIELWTEGADQPTLRQARLLANALRIPFGYLYLTAPPHDDPPLPDRRSISGRERPSPSADLLDVVYSAKRSVDWYREYRIFEEKGALPFVASSSSTEEPKTVAERMRADIGVDDELNQQCRSWAEYLLRLTEAAENRGILVFRNGVVGNNTHRALDVKEFRGFAMSDRYAPLVFINARDAKSAQIFTLVHELAHIWIGDSAVSNIMSETELDAIDQEVERFCDIVATEFLVPKLDFLAKWDNDDSLDEAEQELSRYYRVSGVMILRRALELNLITKSQFYAALEDHYSRAIERSNESSGGSFTNNFYARNGHLLTKAVFESVLEGKTLYRDGARLLHLKASTLARLARESVLNAH